MNTSQFIQDDFLLTTQAARTLYHMYAEKMPIFDYHSHLSAKEIYEDKPYNSICEAWLAHDHYKWRLMRSDGVPEEFITGNADDFSKFRYYAKAIQDSPGNPQYHWTHLELQRYFNISECLTADSARSIFDRCNQLITTKAYSVRNLLKKQHVDTVFTTDDPAEDLKYHDLLKSDSDATTHVYPAFRPDSALAIGKKNFTDYLKTLGETENTTIKDIGTLLTVLEKRLDYFRIRGCTASDHSMEGTFNSDATKEKAEKIFEKRLRGESLTEAEIADYKGFLIGSLGRIYKNKNIVMQLHIGAVRNVSSRRFEQIGSDAGCDSMNDINYAEQLGRLLDSMDKYNELPKIILYALNPKDVPMIASLCGDFQNGTARGNVQPGTAWWFNDTKTGMENQITIYAQNGALATFIGMTTDSRSFLSYPRHEYFRRILCNLLGTWVKNGEYPDDIPHLGEIVNNISFNNAHEFFQPIN